MSAAAENMKDDIQAHFNMEDAPIEYDVTEAVLNQLHNRWKDTSGIDPMSKEGYEMVVGGIKELRPLRLAIEDRRKLLKKGALEYGRKVDDVAKSLTERITSLENPLKELKKEADDEKARIKEAAVIKEQLRLDGIHELIEAIKHPAVLVSPSTESGAIKAVIAGLEEIVINEATYQEFTSEAEAAKSNTLLMLGGLLAKREKWEAEEVERKAAQAKLDAERADFEKQKAEMAEQQRKFNEQIAASEKAEADKKAAAEKEQAIKQAAEEAEARVKAEAEAKQKAAAEQQAIEEAEAKRQADLAPVREKIAKYGLKIQQFALDNQPGISEEHEGIINELQNDIVLACKRMNKKVQEL